MNRRGFVGLLAGLVAAPSAALGLLRESGPTPVPSRLIARRRPQVFTWRGGCGHWDDPEMWNPSGVPGADDDVIIGDGAVHTHGDGACRSLSIGVPHELHAAFRAVIANNYRRFVNSVSCAREDRRWSNTGSLIVSATSA